MAKVYVDGELVDVGKPDKTYKKPAGPRIKKQYPTRATGDPNARPPVEKSPTSGRSITRRPSPNSPPGRAPTGVGPNINPTSVGLKPAAPTRPPMRIPAGVGALGGAAGVTGLTEIAQAVTPEGYGPKAGYGNEQSPRDFNEYQGPLSALGKFGAGVDAFASQLGRVGGEASLHLPAWMGGYRQADGTVPMPDDADMQQPQEWYQDRFGVSREQYGDLASGSKRPIPTPLESMTAHDPYPMKQEAAPEGPVEVGEDGKVRANPRYGKPNAPDMARRGLSERLFDVTGGAIPDSMSGFMVANFMQNQLRQDDSRRVGDNKDIYKADLTAMPSYMEEDRNWEMMPYDQQLKQAQGMQLTALAENAPAERAYKEAQTQKTLFETENMPTKQEALEQRAHERAIQDSAKMAQEYMASQGIVDASPEDLASMQEFFLSRIMEGFRKSKEGKTAQLTERTPSEKGGWFSDDVPAIPWGVTY